MAQPQHQTHTRVFPPPQSTASPSTMSPSYGIPPAAKRARVSPGPPSQPGSPYAPSPFAMSPGGAGTPTTAAPSPGYSGPQINLPATYSAQTPYTNGHTANTALNLPSSRQAGLSTIPMPSPTPIVPPQIPMPASASSPYSPATLAPVSSAVTVSVTTPTTVPGTMGPPPTKPGDRPAKEAEHDFADTLAGTGIDLHMEEQIATDHLFNTSRESAGGEVRTGYGYFPPGSKSTLYGAGPANQPGEVSTAKTPADLAAEAAERAWAESAENLAASRTQELNDPFLLVAILHRKADKIAKEHGVLLNLDTANAGQPMGRMRSPSEFPHPEVRVSTKTLPDKSAVVQTTGSWIPKDAHLVDQLALMSIATKQRFRELVGDADRIATTRQKSSHGEVPEEWAEAAAPLSGGSLQDNARTGAESAVSPRANPLKRSFDATNMAESAAANAAKLQKISSANHLAATIRDGGRSDRDWEESRLRKRNARKDGPADPGTPASRSGSVAPATPGSVAPEVEKAPTKKELKKSQAAKAAEALSHGTQNETSRLFAGLGRSGGLFGKKSGKSYSWMTGGGSGASTPTRLSTPGPGGRTATPALGAASLPLTADGRNRLGTWREDKERGKNIQLRDWVVTLEADGVELRALQDAYNRLESSGPR